MARSHTKTEIKVEVNIKPVKLEELRPAQRQLVKRFYIRLFAQVQDEIKGAQKESPLSQAPTRDALTSGGEENDSHE